MRILSEHKFDGLLEYLCGDIVSKSERNDVRDELYDHLMMRYETNLACGMSEDEAEAEAAEHLGDTDELKINLNKIHRRNPLRSFCNGLLACLLSPSLIIWIGTLSYSVSVRFNFLWVSILIGYNVFSALSVKNIKRFSQSKYIYCGTYC